METFEEFLLKNPDVPVKLKVTAVAFFAKAFILTGASIVTSLALTFVYLSVHCGILYLIRSKKVTYNGSSKPENVSDVDTDEEDLDDTDVVVPQENAREKFTNPRFGKRQFADMTPLNVNSHRPSPIFGNAFADKPSFDGYYRTFKTTYNSNFTPTAKNECMISGMEPSQTFRMNQSRHGNRTAGFGYLSPEPQHVLGVDRWKLSQHPLRPTARGIPTSGTGFQKYASDKNVAVNISKPSFQTTSVKLNGKQTSSPFHEQSPVGLWDTMSLSAIAGSPIGNRSSPQMFVESPSPDKGPGLSHRHHPLHTMEYPVDSMTHLLPVKSTSSHWKRLNKKGQTILHITGRPKLQSPLTVRIAYPRSSSDSSEKRHQRRPFMNLQYPGDFLRKDVILSALREKRKRGKPVQGEDGDEENSSSFQEESCEGAACLKKRRLDNYNETRWRAMQPKPRRGNIPAESPAETDTRGDMEVISADNSFESRSGRSSFHRNAVMSSLSCSKIWKDNQRKRSIHSDEQERLPKLPPKKLTRGTDVSDLEPPESNGREESIESNSSKKGDNSQEKEETSERSEQEKTVLSPRLRKRPVFTALHRRKQTKLPSPEQITAADLHEDRQRALQRIQQMRMLLRDEETTLKETPKEADKPLLPVAKSPQPGVNPLAPASSVALVSSLAEVDSRTKPLGQNQDSIASAKSVARLFNNSGKENPIGFGLAGQIKKETPQSSSGAAPVSFGLSRMAPTNTVLITVSSPPASSKPSSLLQVLSGMQKSVGTDSKRGSLLPTGEILGLIGKPSIQESAVTSSLPFSSPSTSALPSLASRTNSATMTTTTATPTFNFGSGSSGLLKDSGSTNVLSTLMTQPTLQFGSVLSTLTTSSTGSITQTQTSSSSLFNFDCSAPPTYGSSQSIANQTVSSSSAPVVSSVPVSVQSSFMFRSSPAVTQSGNLSSGLNFNSGTSAYTSSTAQSYKVGTFSFGRAKQSQPTFSFGQTVKKSQETKPSPAFGFPSGSSTVTTGQETSTGPPPALFSFVTAPSSATATAASSLFQMNTQTTSTAMNSSTTPSPFTFDAAKPPTLSSDAAKAPASFSFEQISPSAGFTFGSQQSPPASQVSTFPSNQSSSQMGGFTFGAPSQKPASQGSIFSSGQTPQQIGFSFGGQSSQGMLPLPLSPSAQQSQSSSIFGSTSTPALNFGAQVASTPGPTFQYVTATPSQQQSTPEFNFPDTPSTDFSFGNANEEGVNTETRQLFSPSGTNYEILSRPTLPSLVSALLPNYTDAHAFTSCSEYVQADANKVNFQARKDLNVGQSEEVKVVELPRPLMDLASDANSLKEFLDSIPTYSPETVAELERCTRGQALNNTWLLHRKGRITASNARDVLTRSRKLMSHSPDLDNSSLIKRLLYITVSPDIPAIKYGKEMEPEARLNYIKIMRECGHPSLTVDECGLFVDSEQVYLGASPDGMVHCECCGKGVLEIKCPYSVSHTKPDSSNVPYIVECDGEMTLKIVHRYYTQVQLQMGVTKTRWCDFFVYTRYGHVRIRVNFNQEAWTEIKKCSEYFFTHHLAKEMVTKDIYREHILNSDVKYSR